VSPEQDISRDGRKPGYRKRIPQTLYVSSTIFGSWSSAERYAANTTSHPGPQPGVLERFSCEGDDGDGVLYLGVVVEARPRWKVRTFDCPELLLPGCAEELYELPGGLRVLRGGADVGRLIPYRAIGQLAV